MSAEELRKLIAATAENSLQLAVGEQPKLQPVQPMRDVACHLHSPAVAVESTAAVGEAS